MCYSKCKVFVYSVEILWITFLDLQKPVDRRTFMTKSEFISKLKSALSAELNAQKVQENLNYYSEYISDEVRRGRREEEVIQELGDPWAIAKNIITSEEMKSETSGTYSYEPRNGYEQREDNLGMKMHSFQMSWWKILLLIIGVIGILLVVLTVIGGIFSMLMPLIFPLLVIWIVIRLFGNRRR